jgi:hypothetical protein
MHTIDFVRTSNLEMFKFILGNEVGFQKIVQLYSNIVFIDFYDIVTS